MEKANIHTTNYFNTFIEVAEDTKVTEGTAPGIKNNKPTVAWLQYQLLIHNPYKFTSDEIIFQIYAKRNDLTESEMEMARRLFFSKGQACFRSSPLTKIYGFGIHANNEGRMALYGRETEQYGSFIKDKTVKKIKAMRTSRN